MAKTRPINRRAKSNVPLQGGIGPTYMQQPKQGGGAPRERVNPPKATMKNTSMTMPGSGTRGSSKGAH